MSLSAFVKALHDSGVSDAQIVAAMLLVEEERLANGRARAAKYRNNNKNRHMTNVTDVTPLSLSKEAPHTPQETQTLSKENPPKGGQKKGLAREELETVLDREHAEAVIEHRQRLRKPLTAHAAKLLAGKLGRSPDANAAADAMIANGWQGFEPEWLENRQRQGNGRAETGSEQAIRVLGQYRSRPSSEAAGNSFAGKTVEASFVRRGSG